jgi:hypothetical protein
MSATARPSVTTRSESLFAEAQRVLPGGVM